MFHVERIKPFPEGLKGPVCQSHSLPPSSGTGAGEKLANEPKGGQKVSCPHSVEEGKGRGLKCQGAVIRWTQYIRHKSRAYLKVYRRDNRCELHTGRNAQTRSVAH